MNARAYFAVSGVLFFVVSIAHLVRAAAAWPISIDGWILPLYLSWIAAAVAGSLALAAFRLLWSAGN
jgi:hypothetical protein